MSSILNRTGRWYLESLTILNHRCDDFDYGRMITWNSFVSTREIRKPSFWSLIHQCNKERERKKRRILFPTVFAKGSSNSSFVSSSQWGHKPLGLFCVPECERTLGWTRLQGIVSSFRLGGRNRCEPSEMEEKAFTFKSFEDQEKRKFYFIGNMNGK